MRKVSTLVAMRLAWQRKQSPSNTTKVASALSADFAYDVVQRATFILILSISTMFSKCVVINRHVLFTIFCKPVTTLTLTACHVLFETVDDMSW